MIRVQPSRLGEGWATRLEFRPIETAGMTFEHVILSQPSIRAEWHLWRHPSGSRPGGFGAMRRKWHCCSVVARSGDGRCIVRGHKDVLPS